MPISERSIMIQRPATISPWARNAQKQGYKNGSVWIQMKPRKIVDQFSKGAGDIATVELPETFVFLAPLALNENVVHHWEAYESVASRIAQKIRTGVKLGAEGAALTGLFGKEADLSSGFKDVFANNGGNVGASIEKFASRAYGAVQGSKIPKIKVDTPLYYTNSDRRQLILDFQLFHENIGIPKEEVLVKPIQKLMKYSSPDFKGGISIEFPYMWEVTTYPFKFIKYTTCALTAVQPTWNSPYIKGVPSSVNLQLTFQDLSPLYRNTIELGSVINVISKQEADSRNAQNYTTTAMKNYQKMYKQAQSKASPKVPDVVMMDSR